jgi:polysaccharide export outer membrane protein
VQLVDFLFKRMVEIMKESVLMKYLFLLVLSAALAGCVNGMELPYTPTPQVQTEEVYGRRVTIHPINRKAIEKSRLAVEKLLPAELLRDADIPHIYRLGVNDVIAVTVWEHPELTQPLGEYRSDEATGQVIGADGTMFFPYVGKIKAAGLTREELRELITRKLSQSLENPQVDVKVLSYRSKKVYVGGEVPQPGIKAMTDEPMTLPEALSRAGGLTPEANAGDIWLTRDGKTYTIDFLSMYQDGKPIDKLYLRPGDKIHVPSREENKIYVLGEVVRPRGVPMEHGRLSLTQALGEVGGVFETTADVDAIYVIRAGADRQGIDVYHLSAKNPVALVLGDQFQLQPRDVIYVDNTGLAGWNRFISLILPTASILRSGTSVADDINGF